MKFFKIFAAMTAVLDVRGQTIVPRRAAQDDLESRKITKGTNLELILEHNLLFQSYDIIGFG